MDGLGVLSALELAGPCTLSSAHAGQKLLQEYGKLPGGRQPWREQLAALHTVLEPGHTPRRQLGTSLRRPEIGYQDQ